MSHNPVAAAEVYGPLIASQNKLAAASLKVVLAIEDEDARRQLRDILRAEEAVQIIGEAGDAATAEWLVRLRPDLMIIDLDMPDVNELDVGSRLAPPAGIVLTSEHHHNAVRAFEADALDFLLKPISAERVKKTLARARRAMTAEQRTADWLGPSASETARGKKPSVSRIAAQKGKRLLLLSVKEIYYFTIEDKLVFAVTRDDRFLVNRTITEMEELLCCEGFFQTNRATIINLDFLREIIPWFSGTYRLRLTNDAELPLSRDRVASLKAQVGLLGKKARPAGGLPAPGRRSERLVALP